MKISALLINHNSNGTILKSIQSLLEQDIALEKIVVVDNGSTDGMPKEIRKSFPHVQVMETGENIGLSRARNIGLQALDSDLVLLVDDDVYLSKGSLKLLVNAHLESGATVTCPRVILYPQTNIIQCDGAGIHFTGTLSLRHAYQPLAVHVPARGVTNGFIGACLLMDRKTVQDFGNFDDDYFFYFEDMELSYRLRALGHVICCEENAIVHHERGQGTENLSFRGSGSYPKRRAYFTLRNRWLTMSIHYQLRTLLLLAPALALYETAAFAESLRRGWLKEYFTAAASLFQAWRSIAQRRRRWSKLRKVNDREILSGGGLPFSPGFVNERQKRYILILNELLNLYWNTIKQWL